MTDYKYDLLIALYKLCESQHSGQWSRGYRILSQIERLYKPRNIPCMSDYARLPEWVQSYELYKKLVRKYGKLI